MNKLYELAHNYIHNQTKENAIELVNWCQKEGGQITSYYPTNYLSVEDIKATLLDADDNLPDNFKEPTHTEMKEIAETMGEIDTENGTYWQAAEEAYKTIVLKQ